MVSKRGNTVLLCMAPSCGLEEVLTWMISNIGTMCHRWAFFIDSGESSAPRQQWGEVGAPARPGLPRGPSVMGGRWDVSVVPPSARSPP